MSSIKTIILGTSGASGMIYTIRLINALVSANVSIYWIVSTMGRQVFAHETQNRHLFSCQYHSSKDLKEYLQSIAVINDTNRHLLTEIQPDNFFAGPASGSFIHDGMVVVPCSMKSVAAIANGFSDNLLLRSADVCLKEKRPLILVPRETPFGKIHLKNMLTLADQDVTIIPACPGFYMMPATIIELADFIAARIMDHLKISHNVLERWKQVSGNSKC
ncbi:MAG: 3-octaprenyl-4-hydroxybenzoate carboxy-lyase UbiX [Candidatus Magnetoglobus multicellularis str. Araruama]|uniref:Flavin prenyltransferase UbiX n=1 Tax=Candidatus Magnetoglobus multicellularis str. Araruama TaxID=890399 RepID=A0A1V1PEH3_9BACT|nr:MAG: 3-octaprenyl-4-hydroxybenzoate carboxy-lyase UbiX [Candidatus Magnetoglobus multicellularis str. Araruama]